MVRNAIVVSALVVSACALLSSTAGLRVSPEERERLRREYVGREFVLASSMYVGDFFGDGERRLIDPRPADVLELYHHDGDRAVVKPFVGDVVYAGTPVRVREIIYPTEAGMSAVLDDRSELAPTAHTWVVVEPAEGEGRPMVLVLPRNLQSADAFRHAMTERLGSMQWVASWLSQRAPAVLDAIYAKRVETGMSKAEMLAALGHPRNARDLETSRAIDFVADYGDLQVTIAGNQITEVVSIREQARIARQEAEKAAAEARAKAEQERKEREAAEAEARAAEEKEEARRRAEAERERKKADAVAAREQAKEEKRRAREEKRRAREEKARLAREAKEQRIADAKVAEADANKEAEHAAELARLDREAATAEAAALAARRQADEQKKRESAKAAAARVDLEKEIATTETRIAELRKRHEPKSAMERLESAEQKLREAQQRFEQRVATALEEVEAARVPRAPKGEKGSGRRLGLKTASVDAAAAKRAGLRFPRGAHVVAAVSGGEGERAGLRGGDVVVTFDGHSVGKPEDLAAHASKAPLDRKVYIEVMRDGHREVLSLPAMEGVVDEAAVAKAEKNLAAIEQKVARERQRYEGEVEQAREGLEAAIAKRDAKVAPLEARLARARVRLAELQGSSAKGQSVPAGAQGRDLGVTAKDGSGGVLVVSVAKDSEGEAAGLKARDLIVAFDGRPLSDARSLAQASAGAERERRIFIEVRRGKKDLVLVLPPLSEIAEKRSHAGKTASRAPARPASEVDDSDGGPARLVDPDGDDAGRRTARPTTGRPAFPTRTGK